MPKSPRYTSYKNTKVGTFANTLKQVINSALKKPGLSKEILNLLKQWQTFIQEIEKLVSDYFDEGKSPGFIGLGRLWLKKDNLKGSADILLAQLSKFDTDLSEELTRIREALITLLAGTGTVIQNYHDLTDSFLMPEVLRSVAEKAKMKKVTDNDIAMMFIGYRNIVIQKMDLAIPLLKNQILSTVKSKKAVFTKPESHALQQAYKYMKSDALNAKYYDTFAPLLAFSNDQDLVSLVSSEKVISEADYEIIIQAIEDSGVSLEENTMLDINPEKTDTPKRTVGEVEGFHLIEAKQDNYKEAVLEDQDESPSEISVTSQTPANHSPLKVNDEGFVNLTDSLTLTFEQPMDKSAVLLESQLLLLNNLTNLKTLLSEQDKVETLLAAFNKDTLGEKFDASKDYAKNADRQAMIDDLKKDLAGLDTGNSTDLESHNFINNLERIHKELTSLQSKLYTEENDAFSKAQTILLTLFKKTYNKHFVDEESNFSDTKVRKTMIQDWNPYIEVADDYITLQQTQLDLTLLERIIEKNTTSSESYLFQLNRLKNANMMNISLKELRYILSGLPTIPNNTNNIVLIPVVESLGNIFDNLRKSVLSEIEKAKEFGERCLVYEKICALDDILNKLSTEPSSQENSLNKIKETLTQGKKNLAQALHKVAKDTADGFLLIRGNERFTKAHKDLFLANTANGFIKRTWRISWDVDWTQMEYLNKNETIKKLVGLINEAKDINPVVAIVKELKEYKEELSSSDITSDRKSKIFTLIEEKNEFLNNLKKEIGATNHFSLCKEEMITEITNAQTEVQNVGHTWLNSIEAKLEQQQSILTEIPAPTVATVESASKTLDVLMSDICAFEQNHPSSIYKEQVEKIKQSITSVQTSDYHGLSTLQEILKMAGELLLQEDLDSSSENTYREKIESICHSGNSNVDSLISELSALLPNAVLQKKIEASAFGQELDDCTKSYSADYIVDLQAYLLNNNIKEGKINDIKQKLKEGIELFKNDIHLTSILRRIYITIDLDQAERIQLVEESKKSIHQLIVDNGLPDLESKENKNQSASNFAVRQQSTEEKALRAEIANLENLDDLSDVDKQVCAKLALSLGAKLDRISFESAEPMAIKEEFTMILLSQEDKMANHRSYKEVIYNILAALATFTLSLLGVGTYKAFSAQPFSFFFNVKTRRREQLGKIDEKFEDYLSAMVNTRQQ